MINNSLAKLSLILLLFFVSFNGLSYQKFSIQEMELNGKRYNIEIADTNKRRRQGLMYRQQLEKNAGMLFIYSRPGDYRIWMKNTLIPLAVIWLDEQAILIDKKILYPCRSNNCPVTAASAASKYILELHPAEFDRFHEGDRLPDILQ